MWDVLEMISTSRFCGDEPFAATAHLKGVPALAAIAPAAEPTRSVSNESVDKWIVIGDGWTSSQPSIATAMPTWRSAPAIATAATS